MKRYVYFRKRGSNGRQIGPLLLARCNYCGSKIVKDADCSGDYYPMGDGLIILMSFCPKCGRMKPIINGNDMLSNNKKRKMAIKIAVKYELGFAEVVNKALSSDADNNIDFYKHLSKETNISLKEIKAVLG